MLIDVASHCYSVKFPHYAQALCYQLSSLHLYPPKTCQVLPTVCFDPLDSKTVRVLEYFSDRLKMIIQPIPLHARYLGRRAIGRNIVAKYSRADIVWFADVDQVYHPGCLDRLAGLEWPDEAVMIYPEKIMIHRDHATGDEDLGLVRNGPMLIDINPERFIEKKYTKAIGGVQIVKGEFARQHGYLDGDEKWQRPTDGKFNPCRCDVPYRQRSQEYGEVIGVDLPGMYRLRHTQAAHGREPRL